MSKKTRRRLHAQLKTRVALEALGNEATIAGLAAKYELHRLRACTTTISSGRRGLGGAVAKRRPPRSVAGLLSPAVAAKTRTIGSAFHDVFARPRIGLTAARKGDTCQSLPARLQLVALDI
jgi:hypothetical protein